MGRPGAAYCPASLVVNVLVRPVSTCVTVTVTFGIAAPDGSVTVPTMVPSCADAKNVTPRRSKAKTTTCETENLLKRCPTLRKRKDVIQFIICLHPGDLEVAMVKSPSGRNRS